MKLRSKALGYLGKSLAGNSEYKGPETGAMVKDYKKGSVAEAEKAGNGMMGNKARQVSRSCRILRITVRTSDPRRH